MDAAEAVDVAEGADAAEDAETGVRTEIRTTTVSSAPDKMDGIISSNAATSRINGINKGKVSISTAKIITQKTRKVSMTRWCQIKRKNSRTPRRFFTSDRKSARVSDHL